jgi:hypothetical protein
MRAPFLVVAGGVHGISHALGVLWGCVPLASFGAGGGQLGCATVQHDVAHGHAPQCADHPLVVKAVLPGMAAAGRVTALLLVTTPLIPVSAHCRGSVHKERQQLVGLGVGGRQGAGRMRQQPEGTRSSCQPAEWLVTGPMVPEATFWRVGCKRGRLGVQARHLQARGGQVCEGCEAWCGASSWHMPEEGANAAARAGPQGGWRPG